MHAFPVTPAVESKRSGQANQFKADLAEGRPAQQDFNLRRAQALEFSRAQALERRLSTQQVENAISAQEPRGLQLGTHALGIPSGREPTPGVEHPAKPFFEPQERAAAKWRVRCGQCG